MINAQLFFKNGMLQKASASGHAQYAKKGEDIVCAAVTVLLRTTAATLIQSGFCVKTNVLKRGEFVFKITNPDFERQKLTYAGDFLFTGLQSLVAEYPECVCVKKIEE